MKGRKELNSTCDFLLSAHFYISNAIPVEERGKKASYKLKCLNFPLFKIYNNDNNNSNYFENLVFLSFDNVFFLFRI